MPYWNLSMSNYCVYIMTNKPSGVLYVGVTNDLAKRVYEHKNNITAGFTSKYELYKLVYYNYTDNISQEFRSNIKCCHFRRAHSA